jgi:hypothetical protein
MRFCVEWSTKKYQLRIVMIGQGLKQQQASKQIATTKICSVLYFYIQIVRDQNLFFSFLSLFWPTFLLDEER